MSDGVESIQEHCCLHVTGDLGNLVLHVDLKSGVFIAGECSMAVGSHGYSTGACDA